VKILDDLEDIGYWHKIEIPKFNGCSSRFCGYYDYYDNKYSCEIGKRDYACKSFNEFIDNNDKEEIENFFAFN
jgi:hypothetical protein